MRLKLVAAAFVALMASEVHASTYLVVERADLDNQITGIFSVDTSTQAVTPNGLGFDVGVTGGKYTFGGAEKISSAEFYNQYFGDYIDGGVDDVQVGPQLWSGTTSKPAILPGSYSFANGKVDIIDISKRTVDLFLLAGDQSALFIADESPSAASIMDGSSVPFAAKGHAFTLKDPIGSFLSGSSNDPAPAIGDVTFLGNNFGMTFGNEYFVVDDQVLFSGTSASPTFNVGHYDVESSSVQTLDIIRLSTAAVPEPATWTLMVGGIGFAGATLRRRQRVVCRAA